MQERLDRQGQECEQIRSAHPSPATQERPLSPRGKSPAPSPREDQRGSRHRPPSHRRSKVKPVTTPLIGREKLSRSTRNRRRTPLALQHRNAKLTNGNGYSRTQKNVCIISMI